MDALAVKLAGRLRKWKPATARVVRAQVNALMKLADEGTLELIRTRRVEQDVLDMIDAPASRRGLAG
jgi:hypothetical protein